MCSEWSTAITETTRLVASSDQVVPSRQVLGTDGIRPSRGSLAVALLVAGRRPLRDNTIDTPG